MKRVTVVMGGDNREREVSLRSGIACADALRKAGYETTCLDIRENTAPRCWIKQLIDFNPDVIFNALHGSGVEDGRVQGLFESLRIPYTHSGVLASAIGMHKAVSKLVFREAGLPVARHLIASALEASQRHVMEPPYVLKPLDQGSSVGVHVVQEGDAVPRFLASPGWGFDPVMIEEYIPGFELTCGVLDGRPMGVLDVRMGEDHAFYDYDAKYAPGGSCHKKPDYLPQPVYQAIESISVRAHKALGCRGVTRSDFRFDPERGEKGLFLLEINTQPGMTSTSLVPDMAESIGMSYVQLVEWMVQDASCFR